MANSSILGGAPAPAHSHSRDVDALGPSDSSDSGSDVQTDLNHAALPDESAEGALPIAHDSTSDAAGTGERASADAVSPSVDADLLPDRLTAGPDAAGPAVDELAQDDTVEDDPDARA
ncbi:MAG: hypothetical protein EOO29_50235 [Comamonadaceae bacterium]|nr:MAG: hypothetical protein EOO29_50235 [Comamonadaceae bacterium]